MSALVSIVKTNHGLEEPPVDLTWQSAFKSHVLPILLLLVWYLRMWKLGSHLLRVETELYNPPSPLFSPEREQDVTCLRAWPAARICLSDLDFPGSFDFISLPALLKQEEACGVDSELS